MAPRFLISAQKKRVWPNDQSRFSESNLCYSRLRLVHFFAAGSAFLVIFGLLGDQSVAGEKQGGD